MADAREGGRREVQRPPPRVRYNPEYFGYIVGFPDGEIVLARSSAGRILHPETERAALEPHLLETLDVRDGFHLATPPLVWLALTLCFAFGHAAMYGPQAAFFAELFGTRVRYTGASLGSQLSSVLAGGLAPFVATALLTRLRGTTAVHLDTSRSRGSASARPAAWALFRSVWSGADGRRRPRRAAG